jgi:signal transduction histidine kinase
VGLPVRLELTAVEPGAQTNAKPNAKTEAKIDAKIDAHDSRPDIKLVLELAETLIRHHDIVTSSERARAVGELATQLAHDIRSPLAALKAANYSLGRERPDEAELIHAASSRIQEIADDLLDAHRMGTPACMAASSEAWCVVDEVGKLITQKRAEYGSKPGLDLSVDFDPLGHGLKTIVNRVHVGRALSNLINNSVEAVEGAGQVSCRVGLSGKSELEITISDSGGGFPLEFLAESEAAVEGFGVRSSKPSGLGLGLKHAREFAAGAGGRLVLGNLPDGSGARVRLVIPARCPPPFT